MKKYFALAAIAATLVFSISSCVKEDEVDYTEDIVGTYTGTLSDSSAAIGTVDIPNEQISITKIDNSHVRVLSHNSGNATGYEALVIETESGHLLTITPYTESGKTVTGYSIPVNGTTANGFYKTATEEYAAAIKISDNSGVIIETFIGVKQ